MKALMVYIVNVIKRFILPPLKLMNQPTTINHEDTLLRFIRFHFMQIMDQCQLFSMDMIIARPPKMMNIYVGVDQRYRQTSYSEVQILFHQIQLRS